MKFEVILCVSRNNKHSSKAIKCFEAAESCKNIKKSISIRKELYYEISEIINNKKINFIIQEKQPSSLFHHIEIISRNSKSEYIMFLHDDDLFNKNFIMRMYKLILKHKPAAIASKVKFIDQNDREYPNRQYKAKNSIIKLSKYKVLARYFLPFERSIIFPPIAYRRNILINYFKSYKRNLGIHEDVRIVYFASINGLLLEDNKINFSYRLHSGQMSDGLNSKDRLKLIYWLKNLKINYFYKKILLIFGILQYLIYSNQKFSNNNLRGRFMLFLRKKIRTTRQGGIVK